MASLGSIFVRLGLRTKDFDTGWRNAEGRTKRGVSAIGGQLKTLAKTLAGIGAAFAVAFAGFGVVGIKEAAGFETALVSVVKTTNLAGAELAKFEGQIESLERTIPQSAQELLGLASVAGQMGVRGADNISKFTKTLAQLQGATDIIGEDGARSLTRLLNITGESITYIDRLGASLVFLGNNAAATESEIVHMAQFVGQSIGSFGVLSADIVGLSTAMKELGLRAESSGSAVGRAFITINTAIQTGGGQAAGIAKSLGLSVAELQAQFKDDPIKVFVGFLEALKKDGDKATLTLDKLGLSGAESARIFPTLAKNVDLVKQRLQESSQAWRDNTALQKEAEAAANTFDAQVTVLKNNFKQFARGIGQAVLPQIKEFIKKLNEAFATEPEKRLENIVKLGQAAFKDLGTILVNEMKKAIRVVSLAFDALFESLPNKLLSAFSGPNSALYQGLGDALGGGVGQILNNLAREIENQADNLNTSFLDILGDKIANAKPLDLPNADALRTAFDSILEKKGLPFHPGGSARDVLSSSFELFPVSTKPLQDAELVADRFREAAEDVTAMNEALAETATVKLPSVGSSVRALQEDFSDAFSGGVVLARDFQESLEVLVYSFSTAWQDFVLEGEFNFERFTKSILANLALIQLKFAALRLFENLGGEEGSGGFFQAAFRGIAAILSGTRAGGGPVAAGSSYLVGERGPEIFTPSHSGNIIPNGLGARGGAPVVNQYIDLKPGVSHEELAKILPLLKEATLNDLSRVIDNGGRPAARF